MPLGINYTKRLSCNVMNFAVFFLANYLSILLNRLNIETYSTPINYSIEINHNQHKTHVVLFSPNNGSLDSLNT